MWTTASIRRQLARMTGVKPFSIREFLAHGSRWAVDQAFHRLVETGEIVRVARGLYIKQNSPWPSVLEVATAKAAAFRRTMATHGAVAAVALKIDTNKSMKNNKEHLFATNGRSTSFRFGDSLIRLIGTSARKMYLGEKKAGLAIRAIWHVGKRLATMETASYAIAPFGRSDRVELQKHADLMPAWMQEEFLSIKRYWQNQWKAQVNAAQYPALSSCSP